MSKFKERGGKLGEVYDGELKISGLCYEDIVSILWKNGYKTVVETESAYENSKHDYNNAIHTIYYKKQEMELAF